MESLCCWHRSFCHNMQSALNSDYNRERACDRALLTMQELSAQSAIRIETSSSYCTEKVERVSKIKNFLVVFQQITSSCRLIFQHWLSSEKTLDLFNALKMTTTSFSSKTMRFESLRKNPIVIKSTIITAMRHMTSILIDELKKTLSFILLSEKSDLRFTEVFISLSRVMIL